MDTFGWDTVYAVSTDQVNASLVASTGAFPTVFTASGTDFEPYSMTGTLGGWSIIPGGSEQLLWVKSRSSPEPLPSGPGATPKAPISPT